MKKPLFVALDMDNGEEALLLADQIKNYVGGFKIGPRLLLREGASLVQELSHRAPVFVDNKYYDIPSTMVASVRATFEMGASYTTVHASAGREALMALRQLEEELNEQRFFKILSVTVLTSFSQQTRPPHWRPEASIESLVLDLAALSIECGITGIVCSPLEVKQLRKMFPNSFLVTPGVRFSNERSGDQKRCLSPVEAMNEGASAIVVGRPVVHAADPVAVAKSYCLAVQK